METGPQSSIESKPAKRVLEIGASGDVAPWLYKETIADYPDAQIVRSDRSKKDAWHFHNDNNLSKAREKDGEILERTDDHGMSGKFSGQIDYVKCRAEDLSFLTDSFDEVVMRNVWGDPLFLKQADKNKVRQELLRVLKPGGELIIVESMTPDWAADIWGAWNKADDRARVLGEIREKFVKKFVEVGFSEHHIDFELKPVDIYKRRGSDDEYWGYRRQFPYANKFYKAVFPTTHGAPIGFVIVLKKPMNL